MNRLIGVAVFALVFITTSAQAADKGMYFSANWGSGILSDADSAPLGIVSETSVDLGFNLGGAIGYDYGPVRAEFELAYHHNDFNELSTGGVTVPAFGTVSVISLMVNGYYDFHSENSPLVPYLGAGVGLANIEENLSVIGLQFVDDDNTNAFAYQFMAGLGFNINPTTTLTAGYRFFATLDPEFKDSAGTPFDSEYQSHEITLGIRVAF